LFAFRERLYGRFFTDHRRVSKEREQQITFLDRTLRDRNRRIDELNRILERKREREGEAGGPRKRGGAEIRRPEKERRPEIRRPKRERGKCSKW
jgi:hypothetical protein